MTARVSGPRAEQGPNKAGFVFGDAATAGNKPNTVNELTKLDAYIVSYNEGDGKRQTRIILRMPGSDVSYILNEKVGGARTVVNGSPWFNKAIVDKLNSVGTAGITTPAADAVKQV